jgi:hypothetical protein
MAKTPKGRMAKALGRCALVDLFHETTMNLGRAPLCAAAQPQVQSLAISVPGTVT